MSNGIAGFDYPRPCVCTDGQEIFEEASLYDWELAERNKWAKEATDDNIWWTINPSP
jgi:hypothetical protein